MNMNKTDAYLETLSQLRRDLVDAETRANQLRDAITVIERLVPQEDLFMVRARSASTFTSLAHLSMVDAAEAVLREAGQPMHITGLTSEMLQRGFPYPKGKDALRASLTGSIERKASFVRVAPATYGLAIWKNGNGKHPETAESAVG